MHARYVRVWFLAGLVALGLSVPLVLSPLRALSASLATAGLAYLALALALGLLPAFARRDWPSPVHAWAALLLGALGVASFAAPRVFHALLGASLVIGALQPLALLLSPRWSAPPEPHAHEATDRAALAGLVVALAGAAAGGLLLIALPRGLPHAALVVLLLGCALPAALAALLFVLPRLAEEPLSGATLAYGAYAALALGAAGLAWAFARASTSGYRVPVALVALGYALAATTLLRAQRPSAARSLLGSGLALAVLAALALLLAMLFDVPNALLPVALAAHLALAATLLAAALVLAAPLLLPGRARDGRWSRWAPALLIASLFLLTPAIQYDRSAAPAALVGALGIALLLWGLAPMGRARGPGAG